MNDSNQVEESDPWPESAALIGANHAHLRLNLETIALIAGGGRLDEPRLSLPKPALEQE